MRGLYLITDSKLADRRPLGYIVESAIRGGARIVQYREKSLSNKDMIKEAQKLKKITERYRVPLIINDRVEVALKTEAEGVHLGREDMDLREARRILGKEKIIGASANNFQEAAWSCSKGADYLGIGPVSVDKGITKLKPDVKKPIPLELISKVKEKLKIPVFGIGGINRQNAPDVIEAGADGVAVIRAIFKASDPYLAAKELSKICEEYSQKL